MSRNIEGLEPPAGLYLDSPKLSVLRQGFPPVLAAQVLRLLGDHRLRDVPEGHAVQPPVSGVEPPRARLRELLGRYPEVLSALDARGAPGSPP